MLRTVPHDLQNPDEEVAREILRYFLRHPEAVDNLAGIARWRLMQETVRTSVEKTTEALAWLIGEGFMREETRMGTGQLFRLNPERRNAAERYLRQGRDGAKPDTDTTMGQLGREEPKD
jgi:hypothetical protein